MPATLQALFLTQQVSLQKYRAKACQLLGSKEIKKQRRWGIHDVPVSLLSSRRLQHFGRVSGLKSLKRPKCKKRFDFFIKQEQRSLWTENIISRLRVHFFSFFLGEEMHCSSATKNCFHNAASWFLNGCGATTGCLEYCDIL